MYNRKVEVYYPGWTKKALTFSIDDGNIALDRKFLRIVNPAGLHGTFNLVTPLNSHMTPDEYRAFYAGHEIANHCRYHAYPFTDGKSYAIQAERFNPDSADPTLVYRTDEEGLYRIHTYAWTYLADDRTYQTCVDRCQKELESVFGNRTVRGYVWPCGEQKNAAVFQSLKEYGFQSIRKTGIVGDTTAFSIPKDRYRWSYNADHTNLLNAGKRFDEWLDDGELKFFCFGVHSHDYEKHACWDVLEAFCSLYGNRPHDFWYAPVASVFDYEDAIRSLRADSQSLFNPSNLELYLRIDGKPCVLKPNEPYKQ